MLLFLNYQQQHKTKNNNNKTTNKALPVDSEKLFTTPRLVSPKTGHIYQPFSLVMVVTIRFILKNKEIKQKQIPTRV